MLARKQEIFLQINQLLDALILGLTLWVCHSFRMEIDPHSAKPFTEFYWLLAVIVPFGPFFLEIQGYYMYPLEKTLLKSFSQITRAGFVLALVIGTCVIFLRLEVPSRAVLLLFLLLAPIGLIARERLMATIHLRRLKNGASGEKIVVAGELSKIDEVLSSFTPSQKLEIQVVEVLDLETRPLSDLADTLHRTSVGRVILAFLKMDLERVEKAIQICEIEGVEAWLTSDFIKTSIAKPTYEFLSNRPMLVFRTTPDVSWSLMVKATLDRVGAALGLIVLSPLFLAIAIAIKVRMPGPVFFTQTRCGQYGRPFRMHKFRSMITDAEMQRLELQAFNEMSGPVFKIANDPRITPLGRWLRKTSLDELPQLLNVLRGEMSLVGPRPLPTYEVEKFESTSHRRRLSMKPGLTCIWQVEGRSNVTKFDDWVRLDLCYIDTWSLWLDLKILIRTIPVVLGGLGAR